MYYFHLQGLLRLLFYPELESSLLLRNVVKLLPEYRRLHGSQWTRQDSLEAGITYVVRFYEQEPGFLAGARDVSLSTGENREEREGDHSLQTM
jgi:hypothetical protein